MKEKDLKIKKYKFILTYYDGKETRMVDIFAPDLQIANLIIKIFSKDHGCNYKYDSFKRTGYLFGKKLDELDSYVIVKTQLKYCKSWDIEEISSSCFKSKYPKWSETLNGKYDNLPRKRFILFNEDNSFTAIDNRTGDCWCEDFLDIISVIKYLFK